ncbi:MAG: aromatic ring-hydroxylating dioxygenase subunit alpha [Proteobacteria bacterium]|nr:aromatic ring-hydroxylating dioxygenase subunit alpha [Pseudomonadota bacterium]
MTVTDADVLEARRDVFRRVLKHIREGTSDLADAPMENAVSVYTDPERHARELQVLFRETPQLVCLSSELKSPGQFRTFDETGVPILVTRAADGGVKAFLNICPHRGARLVRETEGQARRFTCWFHGWTYANDGKLIAAPEAERFCGAMDSREHLVSLACEERHGLVFVMPTPGLALDLDAHLVDFGPVLDALRLADTEWVKSGILPVAANWKYALDTYGEGYHFAALHKNTLAPYFRNDITVYDRFGRHHRVSFAQKDWADLVDKPEAEWGIRPEGAGIHYLFPNTILFAGAVSPGKSYLTVFRHYPGATPGETRTHKAIYAFGGVKSPEHRAEVEAAFDATANVVRTEDYVTAAEGWRNLTFLPAGATVVYGRQEIALQFQHRAIAEAIGLPLPKVAAP